jgi:hypothetical protein
MIQRIQSLYLGIVILLLTFVSTGSTVFRFVTSETVYVFNAFGFNGYDTATGDLVKWHTYPIYVSLIALTLLSFITLMGYKNLTRQLKLVRTTFYIYLLLVIGMVIFSFVGGDLFISEPNKRELGLGYLLFVAGLPFTFLANIAIKRDKALIDSLNRLR